MSLTGAVLGERRTLENPSTPLSSAAIVEMLGGPKSATGRRVSEEGALRLGTVLACVRLLAETTASLPLQVYRRVSGGKELAEQHPLYRVLHADPNPWMTAYTLRETLMGHLCLWGNAFAEIVRDSNGAVTELYPLRPDRMDRPRLSAAGGLLYRYLLPTGEYRELPQLSVLHLRGLGSDGLWGYSPIQLQREAIALALTAEEYQGRFFGNNAQPPGVLEVKGKLSPEAAARLATSWNAAHQGLENAHRIAVLEEGVEWKQVGMPLQDAQFMELRGYQRSEIAGWFRVPPHMIGDVDRSTSWGTGIDSQTTGLVVFTLRPWLVNIEQQINGDLFAERERATFFAEHNVDALMRGDSAARKEFYATLMDRGVLSINDVLALENRNPVADGDQRFVQANMVPLTMAGQQQQAPPDGPPSSEPPPSPAAESSSGIDSIEVGRLLLNIQRLEDAGETDLAQKLRQKLGELILNPQRSLSLDDSAAGELESIDDHRHGTKGRPSYPKFHPSKGGAPTTKEGQKLVAKDKKKKGGGGGGGVGGGGGAAEPKPKAEPKPAPSSGGGFTTIGETPNKAFIAHWDDWTKKLTSKEHGAVELYSGASYARINESYRNPPPPAKIKKYGDLIDSALSKGSLQQNTTVFRGMAIGSDGLKIGGVMRDPGYHSTSTSFEVAKSFSGREGVILRINAPKGTKGAYIAKISEIEDEHELLLPRNTSFKIKSIKRHKNRADEVEVDIV